MSSDVRAVGARGALRRLIPERERLSEGVYLLVAVVVLAGGTAWSIHDNNRQVKIAAVTVIVIVLGSLVLSTRPMLALALAVVGCLTAVVCVHGLNPSQLSVSGLVMITVALAVGVAQAVRRDRLGLHRISAERVITLIRDRLAVQAELPDLGAGWTIEVHQQAADGAALAGDFVSTRLVRNGTERVLHLAVVDVSGSGITAGPRALLLSGAVGGLLGSVPPEEFLPATNEYLTRQRWSFGFASAVYLRLDVASGAYQLRVAGHPPALHWRPDRVPTWRTSTAHGTLLGVLPSATPTADDDQLRPGDVLVLYTDGVVEDHTGDIEQGTQRLRATVETIAAHGWSAGGDVLLQQVASRRDDDRSVVLIRRDSAMPSMPLSAGQRQAAVTDGSASSVR